MKKPTFINNEIYHIYNRGVDKRTVFLENSDYIRAVHDLFEFNDKNPAQNVCRRVGVPMFEVELRTDKKPRKLLIEILAFCLMPNHYHLLVRQKINDGIVNFMQKLGTGYTNYFNKKYERAGSLFQGRFKAVLIDQESHFIHIPYYIHLNPLDLIAPEWREGEIKDYKKAIKFLESYHWSSYLDYIGKKNFPSVTQRKFLLDFFKGSKEYKKDILRWLKEMEFENIKEIILE